MDREGKKPVRTRMDAPLQAGHQTLVSTVRGIRGIIPTDKTVTDVARALLLISHKGAKSTILYLKVDVVNTPKRSHGATLYTVIKSHVPNAKNFRGFAPIQAPPRRLANERYIGNIKRTTEPPSRSVKQKGKRQHNRHHGMQTHPSYLRGHNRRAQPVP